MPSEFRCRAGQVHPESTKKKKKRCLLKKASMWESRHGWRNGRKTRMRLIGVSDGKKYGLSKGY